MARTLVSSLALTMGALLLPGCDQGKKETPSASLSRSQKVEAIASTLQACSYDGRPVTAQPAALSGPVPQQCSVAINRIMGFTGLPANFVVVSGPVDNAAAVILLDEGRVPRRVIAFNPKFMAAAQAESGSPWGPISVMAHEIGHHLSGHTIVPGGSRPEIELEADKFSGFVLYKMGAPLEATTRMIAAVGSDHASFTHPDKQARMVAIREGWVQSCEQSGRTDCGGGDISARPDTGAGTTPVQPEWSVARTVPSPGSIPFKYGRFIIDETGKLDPVRARAMDQRLYALAKDVGVEMTFIVVNDLHGMTAQDYAWAMMRQLRVGKLDVGNGAVAVVAPRQHRAAVAFGPGLAKEAEFSNPDAQLLQWIDAAWGYCDDADGCKQWTNNLFEIFNLTLNNAAHTKWTIQYQTLGQLLTHYDAVNTERMRTKRTFDDRTDQPLGNLIRVTGTVTSLTPPTGIGQVNASVVGGKLGYTAAAMTTDDGYPVILYIAPRLAGLMPSGTLKAGQKYTMVGRLQRTGDRGKQASALWLFSYDPIR